MPENRKRKPPVRPAGRQESRKKREKRERRLRLTATVRREPDIEKLARAVVAIALAQGPLPSEVEPSTEQTDDLSRGVS